MRAPRAFVLAACFAAACASASFAPVPQELRGCWIERRGETTLSMRWFPENAGSSWRGDMLTYRPGAEPLGETYSLGLSAGEDGGDAPPAWAICGRAANADAASATDCRRVFFRDTNQVRRGGPWAELRATPERLVFTEESEAGIITRFDGQRDGCD
ncbi:MAG: hypothetical protein ABW199_07505 [Caulobacterales bacterium]